MSCPYGVRGEIRNSMHGIEIETEWAGDVYFLSVHTLIGGSQVKLAT
jgi:hypothetical protein